MAALEGDGGVGCQLMLVSALFPGAPLGLAAMVLAASIHALLIETNVKTFYTYSGGKRLFWSHWSNMGTVCIGSLFSATLGSPAPLYFGVKPGVL